MKQTYTLLPVLLLITNLAVAQEAIKEYVIKNTYQIVTGNLDTLYDADLEKFGQAIGDKRIVFLGEQEHGDAAAFQVKTRLIKYLHEKKGFNVLAFESDFFSLTEGWDNLGNKKTKVDSFARQNIFPIWTFCHTCQNLFNNYIPQTQNTSSPLQLSGFDCQFHGVYAKRNGKTFFENLFARLNNTGQLKNDIETAIQYCDSLSAFRIMKDRTVYTNAAKALENIIEADKQQKEFTNREKLIVQNLISQCYSLSKSISDYRGAHYFRDKQMAENLKWLVREKYKNDKIIVWAHNAHIGKNRILATADKDDLRYMMGDFLYADPEIAAQMYIVGFTSFSGKVSWTTTPRFNRKLKKPRKNSFERWVDANYDFSFTDFTPYNASIISGKAEAFSMKGSIIGMPHHVSYINYWTKIFDGVIFIRNMYGCQPLK